MATKQGRMPGNNGIRKASRSYRLEQEAKGKKRAWRSRGLDGEKKKWRT